VGLTELNQQIADALRAAREAKGLPPSADVLARLAELEGEVARHRQQRLKRRNQESSNAKPLSATDLEGVAGGRQDSGVTGAPAQLP
jgi:hypothetical protein